jgi:hypothetical protein
MDYMVFVQLDIDAWDFLPTKFPSIEAASAAASATGVHCLVVDVNTVGNVFREVLKERG